MDEVTAAGTAENAGVAPVCAMTVAHDHDEGRDPRRDRHHGQGYSHDQGCGDACRRREQDCGPKVARILALTELVLLVSWIFANYASVGLLTKLADPQTH